MLPVAPLVVPPRGKRGVTVLTRTIFETSQKRTALRVANVPDFEAQVESDDPPTVQRLAEEGDRR